MDIIKRQYCTLQITSKHRVENKLIDTSNVGKTETKENHFINHQKALSGVAFVRPFGHIFGGSVVLINLGK